KFQWHRSSLQIFLANLLRATTTLHAKLQPHLFRSRHPVATGMRNSCFIAASQFSRRPCLRQFSALRNYVWKIGALSRFPQSSYSSVAAIGLATVFSLRSTVRLTSKRLRTAEPVSLCEASLRPSWRRKAYLQTKRRPCSKPGATPGLKKEAE